MTAKQYDTVILKMAVGRRSWGAFSDRGFRADVVGSPENRETVSITIEDIESLKKAAKGELR